RSRVAFPGNRESRVGNRTRDSRLATPYSRLPRLRRSALPRTKVDVVGLGLNATDTVLVVREFPALGGKERVAAVSQQAGGQVATALVTCQRLGLGTRYIGKVGDDPAGRFQLASLRRAGRGAPGSRWWRTSTRSTRRLRSCSL